MQSNQPSMFQEYHKNKGKVVDFKPFSLKKEKSQENVRDIALNIFKHFECNKNFEDTMIQYFDQIYNSESFKFEFVNFEPESPIFTFLKNVNFENFKSYANFNTDNKSELLSFEVGFQNVFYKDSKLFKSNVTINFDKEFKVLSIKYFKINQEKEVLFNLVKESDLIKSDIEESSIIESFFKQ